ncbi:MAG: aspartate-semialdehyde dehydrogenase [Bacteroidetes bacterium]|nr:aspartate-semialdehyde dehydrogenase [Bacteroidota bacterium]MBU1799660.1 aspartate-semialdehyde dehydrogenase [Bacteroidota bacterium]
MEHKIKVGILGATGSVGQKFIELLKDHPWFEIAELGASERSAGKKYIDATNWIMKNQLQPEVANIVVKECTPDYESKLIFSGLDSSVAEQIETDFANAGYFVISNSRNHRFDKDVPLMIPEVNADHLKLIDSQPYKGGIVTNPNCSTIGMILALKPLHDAFKIKKINVVTMQALSGGGYPGVPSLDIIDNVIPYIGGEEEKMETEPRKILGKLGDGEIIFNNDIKISAQCNRVAVIDGHLETVQVEFENKPTKEEIIEAWENFKGVPQELNLPFAPVKPVHYFSQNNLPQPKLQRDIENGMAASVGRLREDPLFHYKFIVLSHNTVRGAAGGTILNAELLKAQGYLDKIA